MSWASLPACQLYELHSLSILHKIRCTGEPETLSSRLLVNSSLRSRSADLSLPRVRTEAGRRRPLFGTVQQHFLLTSGLPPEVRSMSLGRFKRSVSDLLLG